MPACLKQYWNENTMRKRIQVTKYSEYGSPVVKSGTERYANGKAANRHLPISVSALRLCLELQGESFQLITLQCQMSSLSQIKRVRQGNQQGAERREQRGGKDSAKEREKYCENVTEHSGEDRGRVCSRRKKSNFEKFIEAGFYDKWSCVGLDGRQSKGAVCRGGRQRLFKSCQLSSFLSHSYLVCLDRHNIKVEQRKRQHGHNWHVDRAALHYSGQ